MRQKKTKAIAGGHLCVDVFNPNFSRQKEIVNLLQPGMQYSSSVNLGEITEPLNPDKEAALMKYLEEAEAFGSISTGGGVSNTGIPLYHLLRDVKLVARVGDDIFSRAIDKVLALPSLLGNRASQVAALKKVPGEMTSFTIIMNPGDGRPTFYAHAPAANHRFSVNDLNMSDIAEAEAFEFSYPTLISWCYKNKTNLRDLFKPIADLETKVYVDMHTLEAGKPSGEAPWKDILANALPHVHRFMPSLPEALYIFDRTLYEQYHGEVKAKGGEFLDSISRDNPYLIKDIANFFLRMGAKGVVLKCGKAGAYLETGPGNGPKWSNRQIFVNTYRENIFVDSKGAGDVSIAAEMGSEIVGHSPVTCLKNMVAAGTLNVEHEGAIGAFSSFEDLREVRTKRETLPFNPGRGFQERLDYFVGSEDILFHSGAS